MESVVLLLLVELDLGFFYGIDEEDEVKGWLCLFTTIIDLNFFLCELSNSVRVAQFVLI